MNFVRHLHTERNCLQEVVAAPRTVPSTQVYHYAASWSFPDDVLVASFDKSVVQAAGPSYFLIDDALRFLISACLAFSSFTRLCIISA